MKDKRCEICYEKFQPTGPAGKYCKPCGIEHRRKSSCARTAKYRAKYGLIQKPGVGKGGNQRHGRDNTEYKNGSRFYQNNRHRIKRERRYCERCGKDLEFALPMYWCVHHIDHNQEHNVEENFELLCKRCHQLEHNCRDNLNVQRLSERSTPK